jgi:HEAT repeat protein
VPALAKEDMLERLKQVPQALAPALAHREVRARLAALYVLETLRDEGAPAIDALVGAAKDDNAFVRWGVARVLGHVAPREAEKAVPALTDLVADKNPKVALTALKDLQKYGPKAAPAVKALEAVVPKGEPPLRVAAIGALAAVGAEARGAVPLLTKVLEEAGEAPVRAAAAGALARLGGAEAAEKALRKALDDEDAEVRRAASDALLGDK